MRETWKQVGDLLRTRSPSPFKEGDQAFTRDGPLQPELLIALLLYLVGDGGRRGYGHLLEAFWEEARDEGVALPTPEPVSAAAFCKARHKLRPEAIRALLRQVAGLFERTGGRVHRFGGRRCFAVDATKIPLQRSDALWETFGGPSEGFTPQVMVTTLFDVIAKLPVDATIAPYASCERTQLRSLVESLQPGDVVVLDQGYPSYDLLELLRARGIDFVVRVPPVGGFPAVETFLQSELTDCRLLLIRPGSSAGIELRAVRTEGPDGAPQVFLTSLRRQEFSRPQILRLYELRWEIELFYRLEKGNYLGHHQFHAQSPAGVQQEVFALLLLVALTRTCLAAAARAHHVPYDPLSQKGALFAVLRSFTVWLLHQSEPRARRLLHHLLERLARMATFRRWGRSFPRRSFKPQARWGPHGKL